MDSKLLHILQHSLGVDQYGQGNQYRNFFGTDPGGKDFKMCQELVSMGLMKDLGTRDWTGDEHCFVVTDIGKEVMAKESPAPPKVSRAKKRYMAYLKSDGRFNSFSHFLKYNESCRKDGEQYV